MWVAEIQLLDLSPHIPRSALAGSWSLGRSWVLNQELWCGLQASELPGSTPTQLYLFEKREGKQRHEVIKSTQLIRKFIADEQDYSFHLSSIWKLFLVCKEGVMNRKLQLEGMNFTALCEWPWFNHEESGKQVKMSDALELPSAVGCHTKMLTTETFH